MERKRGTFLVLAIALIISIIGLGIAFAAFTQNLTINGSATVQSSNWDIHYAETNAGTAPSSTGKTITATTSNTQSGVTSTAASTTSTLKPADFTWAGTFKTPGDRISYTFYVCNKGSFGAKLTSINTPQPTCTKGGQTETTICSKITYGVYTNSTGTAALAQNETLASGACKQIWVIATLASNITAAQLPNADVSVTESTITMTWTQQ